jgi:hypothetical protein
MLFVKADSFRPLDIRTLRCMERIEDQMNGKKPEPSKRFFMGRADMAIESLSHRCIES